MLEIKRKNLNEEGSWGNLLEQLKLAHTNPAMREEIGRAQKQSLGFDYDFYEQLFLQFIADEVCLMLICSMRGVWWRLGLGDLGIAYTTS